MTEIRILVAGFGRFPGSPINPSGLLVTRLMRRRRPALGDIHRIIHVFPTEYETVARDLPDLIAREMPDAVVRFGVAPRAKRLRVETVARNRMSLLFPDAARFKPETAAIERGAASRRSGRFPTARLLAAARGVHPVKSVNAGTYLCNYAFWHALGAAAQPGGPRLAAFVHIPPPRFKPRPRSGRNAATLPELTYAAEAIVLAVAALARGTAVLQRRRGCDNPVGPSRASTLTG
jgi:pyroglutamyl-peptidase